MKSTWNLHDYTGMTQAFKKPIILVIDLHIGMFFGILTNVARHCCDRSFRYPFVVKSLKFHFVIEFLTSSIFRLKSWWWNKWLTSFLNIGWTSFIELCELWLSQLVVDINIMKAINWSFILKRKKVLYEVLFVIF